VGILASKMLSAICDIDRGINRKQNADSVPQTATGRNQRSTPVGIGQRGVNMPSRVVLFWWWQG
jgi:hypothetical protein